VRMVVGSPKYTGLAKRTENRPWSSHAAPKAATTGRVVHAATVTTGTSPPRKPNSRASPSSWILFSHESWVGTATTWYAGSSVPTTRASRLNRPSGLGGRAAVAAGHVLVRVPAHPRRRQRIDREGDRRGRRPGRRHRELLWTGQGALPLLVRPRAHHAAVVRLYQEGAVRAPADPDARAAHGDDGRPGAHLDLGGRGAARHHRHPEPAAVEPDARRAGLGPRLAAQNRDLGAGDDPQGLAARGANRDPAAQLGAEAVALVDVGAKGRGHPRGRVLTVELCHPPERDELGRQLARLRARGRHRRGNEEDHPSQDGRPHVVGHAQTSVDLGWCPGQRSTGRRGYFAN